MGGHISVGVRRADGSFRTIGVWTNPLTYAIRDAAFRVHGSLEPLDRVLADYLDQEDGKKHFGGPQETVPGEYGYVLVDEISKTVTTMNSYSSPQWVHEMDLGYTPRRLLDGKEMAELRKAAVGARYVPDGVFVHQVYESLPPFTTDEAMHARMKELTLRGADPNDPFPETCTVTYEIAFPAWTIVDLFPCTAKSFRRMFDAVEAATTLTDGEKAAWERDFGRKFGGRALSGSVSDSASVEAGDKDKLEI